MKITDVKLSAPWYVRGKESTDATVVNPAIRSTTLLEIMTDEGVSGFTAVSELNLGPQDGSLNKVLIENAFKPLVVGEDPMDTERMGQRAVGAERRSACGDGLDRYSAVGSEREDTGATGAQTVGSAQGHRCGLREQCELER